MTGRELDGAAPRDDERPPTWALLVVAVAMAVVIVALERLGVTVR